MQSASYAVIRSVARELAKQDVGRYLAAKSVESRLAVEPKASNEQQQQECVTTIKATTILRVGRRRRRRLSHFYHSNQTAFHRGVSSLVVSTRA